MTDVDVPFDSSELDEPITGVHAHSEEIHTLSLRSGEGDPFHTAGDAYGAIGPS
jgi:hypothetical protein